LPGTVLTAGTPKAPVASDPVPLTAEVLVFGGTSPTEAEVTSGALDGKFQPFKTRGSHLIRTTLWLRLPPPKAATGGETPVLLVRSGMDQPVEVFAQEDGTVEPLRAATLVPKFGGAQDTVFPLNPPPDRGTPLYVRVSRTGTTATDLQFTTSTLERTLS